MNRKSVFTLTLTVLFLSLAGLGAGSAAAVEMPERNPKLTDDKTDNADKTGNADKTDETDTAETAEAEDSAKDEDGEEESGEKQASTETTGSLPIRNPKLTAKEDDAPSEATSDKPKGDGPDFAAILKPILSYKISESDAAHLKEAIRSAYSGNGGEAAKAIERLQDPSAKELATWYAYKSKNPPVDAATIEAFRKSHPLWPSLDDLREAAERQLFLSDASAAEITAFFENSRPETGAGKAAMASVYLTLNDKEKARAMVASAWHQDFLQERTEKKILAEFGEMLSDDDHRARIDMLMYPDDSSVVSEAKRIAKLMPEDDQKKVEARIAILKRRKNAGKLLDAIPEKSRKDDYGLLFNHVQYLRRTDKEEEAWKLLLSAPSDPEKLGDMEQWWIERRINCRIALRLGHYDVAYKIAAAHGPIEGEAFTEAEFLAGWIALRFLDKPKTALTHFLALRAAAEDSKTLSRAEYWMGRTAQALGDRRTALLHFASAARYPQHYYGQLGRQALDAAPARLEVTPTPKPTEDDIRRFMSRHAVRAIGVAIATDYDALTPYFFISLARTLDSPAEVVLLAELAKQTGNRQISIRLAKIAFNRDMPVGDYALPIGVIPNFVRLSDKVDVALVHALSRQESEFNAEASSPVGAQGLMQLMPSTAKLVARQFNVKYSRSRLSEPAYNVQLGEAHLGDLIKNYDGSYFLALVAYNAGPGRVRQWVEAFGDPRDPDVDPIDWVESIPFTETRHYVIKIMESLQLYRSRLHGEEKALQLWQDLNRGKPANAKADAETGSSLLRVQASSE